ncbi:hypothetical protein EDB81DRAFT_752407 [Dactylonectria macrodidyma]|uniref:Uncharacterized protein n=1 Tax=Dactylonectria macrodidyma TaxID=307937 RepID=A0A9P9FX13_9HYPO|nr:hypothetical protein EDB81DRAFT_752407 [Dactylonectria macrodidyma]
MDTTQKEQLRTRKKSHKYMTEAEKWNDMYLILFPQADQISLPSPYYEYSSTGVSDTKGSDSEFTRYEQFLRRELEIRIDERLNPLEENLRAMRTASPAVAAAATATTAGNTSSGGASSQAQQIDSTKVRTSVENELQPFQAPPDFENFEDFSIFDGVFFDFGDFQSGSVEPDLGYGSFPPEKGSGMSAVND